MDKPNQENEPDQGSPAPSVPTIGVTLAPPSSSASSSSAAAADPQPAQTLAYKPSIASIPESTTDSIGPYAPYGGTISAKPSFASFSSSRGLLGASAPFAGHSVTAKPSLADLPESPKSPQETPAQSWPFPKPAAPGAAQPQTQPKPWAPAAAAAAAAKPAVAGGKPGQGQAAPETTKEEYKKKASTFFRIFSYSTTKERVFLAGATFASIASGCTMPFVTIVFGRLVATVTTYYTPGMTEKQAQDGFSNAINECVIYMLYIFAARFVLGYLASLGFRMISLRISATIRLAYMTALLGRPISGLDAVPPGQTAAIITNSANVMQLGISERLSSFISALSLIICALVIAFIHHWKLTLVTSSGLALICICYGVTIPMVVKIMKKVQESEIRASAVASEAFASVRMIAACGAEDKMAERFAACSDESRRRGLKMAKVVAVQQAVVFFTVFATFALTFWFAVKLYLNYEINSIGTLIVVLMSVMMIVMSIGSIAGPLSAAARASAAAGILFLMIDLPPRNIGGLKEPDVTATGAILLTNVNFTYPMRPDVKVLDGLTLRIPAGKITAIVGPSGSGKSTIVGLIERWYELDGDFGANMAVLFFRNGQITTGGKSLKDIDLKWWRSQIGLVQQEPFLFNDTILRNVQYGLVGTQWENESEDKKKELAEQACKEAFAEEFIARLPDGYNTRVGDAGIKLSGGQRQRLAIARAIIRQPKILILDEATSAIDVRGEQIVQAALDRASKNRTTITIAHRLSTIKKADNIVVFNKGKVVQQGTHESLMQTVGGAYWTLATSQQLSMDEEHPEGSEVGEKQQSMDIMESEGTGGAVKTQGDWKTKGFLRSFGTLIIEQRKHWYWYIFLVFGAVVAGGSAPVQAFLFAKLITGFYFVGDLLRDWINFWCLMFTVLACAVGIGYFSLGWAATTLAFDISSTYRKEYFRNIISKSIAFFDEERHSIGGLTAVIASDPQQLQQLLGTNMGFALVAVLNVTGCLTISFYFGWKLTAVALSCSLPIILAAGFFRIRHETQFEAMNRKVFAASATFATEAVGACRTVATLGLEDHILKTYRGLLGDHVEEAWRKSRWSNLVFAGSDAMPLLCMAFVLWYGGKLLASGEYNQFQYLVVYIAVVQGGIGAGQWLSFGPNIAQATAAANRILAMRRKDDSGGQPLPRDSTDVEDDEKGGVRIEFSNVWFRYPTRDAPVLNGLNLTIEKGQFAAVVGASGAGKTSVISLLERFYKIKSGSITYNNTDIYSLSLSDYRSTVSLVAQEPSLFTGTIRANILVGLPSDPPVPDSVLHAVCVEAEIHDFIVSLPEGYDTMVGLKGVALSGGQKQRIAIARALIRRPKLLLLDEATSNLDSGTEKSLQGVFERAKGGMTIVVVAHRLATVQNADVIFVLGDGTVLESGSHAALLAKRGVYYHMCLSQALDR